MLPIRVLHPAHSPIRGRCGGTRPGGRVSADRFGPSRVSRLPVSSFKRALIGPRLAIPPTMASADFPGHFLPGISPGKNALLPGTAAAFTFRAEPYGFAVLCQLARLCRPSMPFLSVGPPVSHSLPPPGRLPFQSWLLVVVRSCFHAWFSYRGLAPHLQRAHAGRTQA